MKVFKMKNVFTILLLMLVVNYCGASGGSGGGGGDGGGGSGGGGGGTTTMSAPTGVSVSPSDTQIRISWTPVMDATYYNIYWATTPGVTAATGTKITNVWGAFYGHTALTNGTAYYYIVTAIKMTGPGSFLESAASAEVNATPQNPAGGGPTGVSATAGNGQITVSWSAVAGATSYYVYRGNVTGVTVSNSLQFTVAASPYIDSSVSNGTPYFYIVTAMIAAGQSLASVEVNAMPQIATPIGVLATAGDGQVTIDWSPVVGAASYNIYWKTTSGVTKINGTKITGVTSPYVHTGRSNGTTYYYIVTAVDAGGESIASSEANAIPQVAIPGIPTGVLATAGNGQNNIAWSAVSGATSYNLYWGNASGVTIINGTKITGVTSPYLHSGLTNGTTYYYIVTAVILSKVITYGYRKSENSEPITSLTHLQNYVHDCIFPGNYL